LFQLTVGIVLWHCWLGSILYRFVFSHSR